MSRKTKHALVLLAIVTALGIVGHMDEQDAQCSWNGCGNDRFAQAKE